MKGHQISYSAAQLEWIEQNSQMPRRQLHRQFVEKFGRSDISVDNLKSLCTRRGWATGRTGQFVRGQAPANKGKKMPYNANSARTRFRKGNVPANVKYLGHERVSKDGYVEISVAETNPHTGYERRYVLKHRHLWEAANGPVPKGMALKCIDGNRQNTDPSNWIAIPRGMLPRLNGRFGRDYDDAPPELKPAIMATAKLEHAVRSRANKKRGRKAAAEAQS